MDKLLTVQAGMMTRVLTLSPLWKAEQSLRSVILVLTEAKTGRSQGLATQPI